MFHVTEEGALTGRTMDLIIMDPRQKSHVSTPHCGVGKTGGYIGQSFHTFGRVNTRVTRKALNPRKGRVQAAHATDPSSAE